MGTISTSIAKGLAEKYKEQLEGASGYKVVIFAGVKRAKTSDGYGAAQIICTLTDDAQVGIGGTFEAPTDGTLYKATSLVFRGVNLISPSAVATWACLCEVGDDLSAISATAFRHDMTVGTYLANPLPDIRMEDTLRVFNNETKLNVINLIFPENQ